MIYFNASSLSLRVLIAEKIHVTLPAAILRDAADIWQHKIASVMQ